MPGVWLWPRLARAVAMVSWCNLLTSMGVIGTKICLAILRKSDLFGMVSSPWWPKYHFWRIVDQTQHRDPTRRWKGHELNYLVVVFTTCFYQFTFQLIAAMKFSHLKISRKCWSGETKRLAVVRQMSWCTAEHSIFRCQQECFERDIEMPRFIIIHGFRVPRKKRHSLCGEEWARLELLQKEALCLEKCTVFWEGTHNR